MPKTTARTAGATLRCVALLSLALGSLPSRAQSAEPAPVAPASSGFAAEPNPYYIGASQGINYDSNVYGLDAKTSDYISSTSLLAAFDQPISRQRVYGTARVSLNRYQDESRLNNTSYNLTAGVDWATIMKLSGNVAVNLDQSLSAPTAAAAPVETKNNERRQGISGLARWGGDSLLTLEARAAYSKVEYSAREYVASESENTVGSLGIFYRPGTRLRLGLAYRGDRTRSPEAVQLQNGSFESNEIRGRNIDLLADYNNGNTLSGSARLSYTRQRNSNFDSADFSGLTGSLSLGYRASGRTSFNIGAARDAGNNSTSRVALAVTPGTSNSPPVITATPAIYENNQVTNSFFAGATYSATSKIGLSTSARYSRARLVSSSAAVISGSQAEPDVVDKAWGFNVGANYAFSRALSFACSYARDRREVSGAISYGYTDHQAGCSAQFLWR